MIHPDPFRSVQICPDPYQKGIDSTLSTLIRGLESGLISLFTL
jgi:hypothetical protein